MLGRPLMPWQQMMADVVGEVDVHTGLLVYGESDSTVPRQSGKTVWLLAQMVHRCQRADQNVVYTAQTRNAARKKLVDEHMKLLRRSSFHGRYDERLSNGSEAIMWANGSKHMIDATSDTSGHGDTLHVGVIDEAFAHHDDTPEQAMAPAMLTVPDSQLLVNSTAGTNKSAYLYRKVLAGRKGDVPGVAYFEWSAPDDTDPGDPLVWRMCMPALGLTISEAKIEQEWRRAERGGPSGIDLFKRAYLNIWVDPPVLEDDDGGAIPMSKWRACRDDASTFDRVVCWAFDTTPDRAWTSLAAAGVRPDGKVHVELVEHRHGTDWVVERVRELRSAHGGSVVYDPVGPAGSLKGDLPWASELTARDQAQGCGLLYDRVLAGQVAHIGQVEVDAALRGGVKRPLLDSWAWSRSKSTVDISPIVAVTMAHRPAAVGKGNVLQAAW